jgi:phospholipase/carboxylesterase
MHLHDSASTLRLGARLAKAHGAVVLVHGRGSSAADIAGLAGTFPGEGIAFLAPEATGHTWYPERFLAPPALNEPWLSSALGVIDRLVDEAVAAGIPHERVGLAGFSQGACLVLEYALRHPRRHAFVAGLSGALIGPTDTPRSAADLARTPVLLGCAERDAHIPLEHVEHSAAVFAACNADVTKLLFPGAAHTVFPEEAAWLREKAAALAGQPGTGVPAASGK